MNDRLMAFALSLACMKEKLEKDERKKQILAFLRELKASDETIPNLYLYGSCFRLYSILKTLYKQAVPYYSVRDGHWVTEIDGNFYDINGRLTQTYVEEKEYKQGNASETASAYVHTYSNNLSTSYNKYEEI